MIKNKYKKSDFCMDMFGSFAAGISKQKIFISLFLIYLFIVNLYSQGSSYGLCPQFNCQMLMSGSSSPQNVFSAIFSNNWMTISMALVLLSIAGISLLYMIARAIHNVELEYYVKSELLQACASIMIILLCIWLVNEISKSISYKPSNVINMVAGTADYSLACAAASNIGYSLCKLNFYYMEIEKEVYRDERILSKCFSIFGFQICPGLMDLFSGGSKYYNINARVSRNHMLGEIILNLQISLAVQQQLLLLIHNNALAWFLPLGIVLRILPFTRGIGGLLIATAVGFFFVFPIAYLIALQIPVSEQIGKGIIPGQICYPSMHGAVVMIQDYMSLVTSSLSIGESATEFIGRLRIVEWILPFVALSITAIFIRYVAPILGGDSGELFSVISKLA